MLKLSDGKFRTKNLVKINDASNIAHRTETQSKCKTTTIRSNLWL